MSDDPLDIAFAAIDDANAADPTDHGDGPLALVQGRQAEAWVRTLDPDAGAALRLAARAHHLRRWAVPRRDYPEGRAGYLRWRRDQKQRHARELGELLADHDLPADVRDRATVIVTKKGLGHDAEVQVFEDAVCLTFLQTQLSPTVASVADDDRMVEVIAKTLTKMSDHGRAAAGTIELDDHGAALVARAARADESDAP